MKLNKIVDERTREWAERVKRISERATTIENRRDDDVTSIPPPCWGAQCVVINGIMYSYGGETEDGEGLEEVFALNPKKMKWIQVATPAHRKKPWHRSCCCLWAIGGRMIMFGGESDDDFRNDDLNHRDYLQSGAQRKGYVNNEIYEFVFEEGREKGKLHEL